jgi:hypothetical protein
MSVRKKRYCRGPRNWGQPEKNSRKRAKKRNIFHNPTFFVKKNRFVFPKKNNFCPLCRGDVRV